MSQESKPGACMVWGKQEMVMFFQSEGSRVPGKQITHFTSVARVQGGHPACWVRSFYALWWDLAEWMEVGSFTFAKSLHCAHGWEESYFFKGKGFSPLSLFFLGGDGILCGPSCPWPHRPLSPGTGVIGVWGHTWQSFASCVLGFIKVLSGRTTGNFQDEWPKPKGPILVWFNWADGYCRRGCVLGHTSIGVRRSWTLAIQILACDHILSFQSSNPEMQIATITDQWKERNNFEG